VIIRLDILKDKDTYFRRAVFTSHERGTKYNRGGECNYVIRRNTVEFIWNLFLKCNFNYPGLTVRNPPFGRTRKIFGSWKRSKCFGGHNSGETFVLRSSR